MLEAIGTAFGRVARRITPDPFAFAILLTFVVGIAGVGLTENGPIDMMGHWYAGFWDLLTFAMQVTLILVAGHVLATSPQARSAIAWLSRLPQTSGQAILLVALTASVAGFLNWGIGLVGGAVMAVTVSASARARGIPVHYPLAAAAGYMGVLIFANGFSSSAALLVTTEGHFLQDQIGIVPLGRTILTPYNLVTTALFLVAIPLLLRAMHPEDGRCQEIDPELVKRFEPDDRTAAGPRLPARTLAQKLERSRAVTMPMALAGLAFIGWFLVTGGITLDLNAVNFLLVMGGMALYGSPVAYVKAIERAVQAAAGVILQFPFYAGIMGMMALSGLVEIFAQWMVSVSTPATLPVTALISASFLNFFVPSAGGQWAVQGPILIEAARALDVPVGQIVMAFSYGDQLTNMIQPFWAIPLLGITALQARDLLGYTAIAMMGAFFIYVFGISLLPLLVGGL